MSKGVLGSPRMRGQSEIIESAEIAGDTMLASGVAVSAAAGENGQLTAIAFNGSMFGGFSVANDANPKQMTISVVRAGLDIPVLVADGQTLVVGDEVGLNADGKIVKGGEAGEVFAINATVRETGVTAVYQDYALNQPVEVADQVSIDLGLGGSATGA